MGNGPGGKLEKTYMGSTEYFHPTSTTFLSNGRNMFRNSSFYKSLSLAMANNSNPNLTNLCTKQKLSKRRSMKLLYLYLKDCRRNSKIFCISKLSKKFTCMLCNWPRVPCPN